MNRTFRFSRPLLISSLKLALSLTVFPWAGSLLAQGALAAKGQATPGAPSGYSTSGALFPEAGFSSPLLDAFQPSARSRGLSGLGGTGFLGAGSVTRSGFNLSGADSPGETRGDLASLFQGPGGSRAPGFANYATLPGAPLQLDLLGRKPAMRLSSPFGTFPLSYQEMFRPKTSGNGRRIRLGVRDLHQHQLRKRNVQALRDDDVRRRHPMAGSFGAGAGSKSGLSRRQPAGRPKTFRPIRCPQTVVLRHFACLYTGYRLVD